MIEIQINTVKPPIRDHPKCQVYVSGCFRKVVASRTWTILGQKLASLAYMYPAIEKFRCLVLLVLRNVIDYIMAPYYPISYLLFCERVMYERLRAN